MNKYHTIARLHVHTLHVNYKGILGNSKCDGDLTMQMEDCYRNKFHIIIIASTVKAQKIVAYVTY